MACAVLSGGVLAREPGHPTVGRPVAGKGLSQLLFPTRVDYADMPEEPVEAPPVFLADQPPAPATSFLQQPGFVAPNSAAPAVPTGFDTLTVAAPPVDTTTGADQAHQPNPMPRGHAAANQPSSPSKFSGLWESFLGTNTRPQPRSTSTATQRTLPAQYPLPAINPVAPVAAQGSQAADSLLEQMAGKQTARPASPSAASAVVSATAVEPAARAADVPTRTSPAVSRNESQLVARRLPAAPKSDDRARPAASLEAVNAPLRTDADKGTVPTEVTNGSSRGAASKGPQPYAVTSAPAAAYPPGSIPTPELGSISKAFSDSTQEGGSLNALWRPISSARNDGTSQPAARTTSPAMARTTNSSPAANASPTAKAGEPSGGDSNLASLMLQPFQLTNGGLTNDSGGTAKGSAAAAEEQPSIGQALQGSALVRQMTMTLDGRDHATTESDAETGDDSDGSTSEILQAAATDKSGRRDRELVALMQELAPEPADLNPETGELVPVPTSESAAAADKDKAGDTLEGADKLGKKPEDQTLTFLRAETVLLKPGESQCDIGLAYIFTDNDFPVLLTDGGGNIMGVVDARFLVRELTVPMEYRVGLHKKVQGFLNLPVGWANSQINAANIEDFRNDGGIGDLTFGLTIQCNEPEANCPYIISTISGTAPTGGDPFTGIVGISPSVPSLGDGFWSMQGTVLCIQQYDPVVVFYGLGMQGSFPHEYATIEFQPGMEFSYILGFGFAVNERITLSTRFFGSYVDELEANGQRIPGTNIEPMTIRMSATISKPCKRFVEPYVEFGINDDSVNSNVGVTWTF